MASVVLPHSLSPGDIYYLADNSMILCVSQSPGNSSAGEAAAAAAAAAATASSHQSHYKSRTASGTSSNPHAMWTPHSVPIGPTTPDLSTAGYFQTDYGAIAHAGPAVTMATLQGPETTAALHQVPVFSNGYMFQQPYMVALQDQDPLLFPMQHDSIDQHQQQHYSYPYAYPQHASVIPAHQQAAYGIYASQHQQHQHQQSQQSPPGGMESLYSNSIVTSSANYFNQASLDGLQAGQDSLQQHHQQQQQSPNESVDGKPDQQQQQQQPQRRPKQQNTNQALEQISKLMLKLDDEEEITPEERQERIRRYTDIALTIPVVWSYVCQLSDLKHEAELSKVYGFLHHLAQCSVTADEWKVAVHEKSCVFSVVDGRLRQKVCPILRVQGRSPEKIETLCDDIKQKPSQRYRVQAKHVLEQLHEFFCSFLPAELPQLRPPEQLVVDHASVLVIYPDTDSFERVNSLLHKLAFTKLCLGPDAIEVVADAAATSASEDPVDAAKRKWESQLRPCSCPHALSLYAVPGKWQAYPLVADSQWELTRAEVGMSTTLSIKASMPTVSDATVAASSGQTELTVGQLSDPVAQSPAGAEAAAKTALFTGSPIMAQQDGSAYPLCSLMDSPTGSAAPPPPPPQPPQHHMPPQQPPNRMFKHPHSHPHQHHPHSQQGGYAPYSMQNRRHGAERQTVPPRFARHVSQNAAFHEHESAAPGPGPAPVQAQRAAPPTQAQPQQTQPQAQSQPQPPQHHQHQQHHEYRPPPGRAAIGRGGRGHGYGRGGGRGGGAARDYHAGHAPQGPPEFRLKENDFPEISADLAAAGNGGGLPVLSNIASTAATATVVATTAAASAGESSPDSANGGASPEQQSGGASGGGGTSYAAALKKSVPPGSTTSKVATVSAIVSATAAASSAGETVADCPTSPTSLTSATTVRRAVASAVQSQPAPASMEASLEASDRDSTVGHDLAGGSRSGFHRGNVWKASPGAVTVQQQQQQQHRPNINGSVGRGGREQGSRNASGSNA